MNGFLFRIKQQKDKLQKQMLLKIMTASAFSFCAKTSYYEKKFHKLASILKK